MCLLCSLEGSARAVLDSKTFEVKKFIDSFWNEPGLKRSLDKIYEIIVYALFSTLVDIMNLEVAVTVEEDAYPLLKEFEDSRKK